MRLYSYVVKHDGGFAPNPFWGYCTLACCKPKIRESAEVGDWVVGTGSVLNIGQGKIIYAMKITEKLTFDQYSDGDRFKCKIPITGGRKQELGDNIYYKDKDGEWKQRKSLFHQSEKNKKRDLSSKNVLISDHYFYADSKIVAIPKEFKSVVKKGPGHKCNFDASFIKDFICWIENTLIVVNSSN